MFRSGGATAPDQVEQTLTLPAGDRAALEAAVKRAKPDRVVVVIPAARTVGRVVSAAPPAGTAQQIAAAMDLIAESQLGSTLPAHRRAAGVLPFGPTAGVAGSAGVTASAGSGSAAGGDPLVALGWAGMLGDEPILEARGCEDAVFVPEAVALAALASAAGASLGGCELALSASVEDGGVLVLARGPKRAVLRDVIEEADDAGMFASAVADDLAQAAGLAGVTVAPSVAPEPEKPRSVRLQAPGGRVIANALIAGARRDQLFLDDSGLLLGAALAVAGPIGGSALSSPLLGLQHDAPIPSTPVFLRAAQALASPWRAGAVLGVCAAVLVASMLGASYGRYWLLQRQLDRSPGDPQAQQAALVQAEFYSLLRQRRWPMTKLLADLTATMPKGVMLESLTLEKSKDVSLSGTTESDDAVSSWRESLARTGVFTDVRTPRLDGSSFSLAATVSNAMAVVPGSTYEAAAKNAPPPVTADSPATSGSTRGGSGAAPAGRGPNTTGNTQGRGRDGGGGGATSGGGSGGAGAGGKAATREPPAPLSDDQIAAMDRGMATREFGARRGAMNIPGLDAATKQRLADEAEKLRQRMQSASGGGS